MSTETIALTLPEKMILQHEDPTGSATYAREQEQLKLLRGVMLMDKVHQEELVKELSPQLEQADIDVHDVQERLEKAAARVVGDIKVSEEFASVKKALRDLKINGIVCSLEYAGLDYNGRGRILIRRTVGLRNNSYSAAKMTGDDSIALTQEMSAMLTEYRALDKHAKALLKQITDAQSKLRDRANRMSDAEGVLSIKQMTADQLEETRGIYEHLEGGITVAALLGE